MNFSIYCNLCWQNISFDAQEYESKRDYIVHLIAGIGFQIKFKPRGAFFLFAELPENYLLSDVSALFTLSFFLVISLWVFITCRPHMSKYL